jgi:hypothetical protein
LPNREIGESPDRSTDMLLGEIVAELRAVKHDQRNVSTKLDSVGRQTEPIKVLVEQVRSLQIEQEKHALRLGVLEADKNRREGAIGLVAWLIKNWPSVAMIAALAAFVAFANGVDVKGIP